MEGGAFCLGVVVVSLMVLQNNLDRPLLRGNNSPTADDGEFFMDSQSFKDMGKQIIDWIDGYMENGHQGPVSPINLSPGELLAKLPQAPPQEAEAGDKVFQDFKDLILPGVTHWNDPRFFGYFPCNTSRPGVLGDLLGTGLGVNAMSWATSPAATELEIRMLEWLGQMIGLSWPGCIQDTASTGTLVAILSAREKAAPVNKEGYYGIKPLVVYTSEHANTVVLKGCWIAGIGEKYIRNIPGDPKTFAMRADLLEEQIEKDVAAGLQPCLVVTTVGTTSSTAVDPVARVAELCKKYGMWQHVDAAMAGSAAILPECRSWLMDGVSEADSFCFNPHKWLFTNFDCSAYFCKDPYYLKKALSIQPVYLETAYDGAAENFRNWGIQLGRRFRALKLWWVIRCFGVEGLQEKIRLHMKMAIAFAEKVKAEPRLVLDIEPNLNTVCFRAREDHLSKELMAAVNATGQAFLTHTTLNGRYVIRVSFGQTEAQFEDVEKLWSLILNQFAQDF